MDTPKYYFFAPLESDIGGPIALGSIIDKPKFADLPLNEAPIDIDDSKILKPPAKSDYRLKTGSTVGGSVGLWADFLGPILGIGGNAGIDWKVTKEQDVSCDLLETRWFRPTEKYIQQSILDPDVKNYIIKNRSWILGNSKIFMVTGIKIAHNASFAYKLIKERGIKFHFGLDGTNSGVPLSIGPEAELRNDPSREESFKIVEPFVMAYRINEIKIKAKSSEIKSNGPVTDGAALGTVPLPNNEEIELFADFEEQDATVADVGLTETEQALEDEDGNVCRFAHSGK
jgi:hypothetical protein